jgi:hypothetical protein
MNRRERRAQAAGKKAPKTMTKTMAKAIAAMNIDELFADTKERVRRVFEHDGELGPPGFNCITDTGEVFSVPVPWRNDGERNQVYGALREAFRKRGVIRYATAAEVWIGSGRKDGVRSMLDPDRTEGIMLTVIERNGVRKQSLAIITRDDRGKPTLGPWDDAPASAIRHGWMCELIDDATSDMRPKTDDTPVFPELTRGEIEALEHGQQAEMVAIGEVVGRLSKLCDQLLSAGDQLTLLAVYQAATRISLYWFSGEHGLSGAASAFKMVAAGLRESPDRFPLFGVVINATEADKPHIAEEAERIRNIFWDFAIGCDEPRLAVAQAFINVAMRMGARAMGSIATAEEFDGLANVLEQTRKQFPDEASSSAAATAEH